MGVLVGTSGYSYKEWKGSFYPDDLPAATMLSFYAGRFDTVEINNTFYRMPDVQTVERWGGQVPEGFVFVLKAPQRITHQKKLAGVADDLHFFYETAGVLGPRLGPVLFQLPPFARKDAEKLRDFIKRLPPRSRAAFEFRHPSWFDEEIYSILREHDASLCAADTDEVEDPESVLVPTASWGYLRLRRSEYGGDALEAWARRIEEQSWSDTYVFFKHEDEGKGPRFAAEFKQLLTPGT
ncbi:MAG TPA: DUF72 domain-containing protein [Thermoanaerobaculia bacterium]|nr:DUF72 domain-containing protein [Thermoanaerobaculia bacterium]